MEHKELLKTMLQDVINDRMEQASVTMHDYFVAKTRDVSGFVVPAEDVIEPKQITAED